MDTLGQNLIERVVLHAGPKRIDLADLLESIQQFAAFYTSWFEATIAETECHGADIFLRLTLTPVSIKTDDDSHQTHGEQQLNQGGPSVGPSKSEESSVPRQ